MPINTRNGNWMQTYTGNRFFPLDPRPDDFNLLDIAHSLSMQCRYNGHVTNFYSVAEHSVLVSQVIEQETENRGLALWGLLHDASETYIGDMVRPLKLSLSEFSMIENKILWAMGEAFNLQLAGQVGSETACPIPEEVAAVDTRILVDEKNTLMAATLHRWDVQGIMPTGAVIQMWSPENAEKAFIQRFEELRD